MISKKELREELDEKMKEITLLETNDVLFDAMGNPRHNIVIDVLSFLSLPNEAQRRIRKEWDDYYRAVRKTKAYKRFVMQKEAFFKNDMALVKEIAAVSRKALAMGRRELKKPEGIDIERLYYSREYQHYLSLRARVAQLRKKLGITDSYLAAKKIFE